MRCGAGEVSMARSKESADLLMERIKQHESGKIIKHRLGTPDIPDKTSK